MESSQDTNGSAIGGSTMAGEEQNDKELLELLQLLENTTPVIPDALMEYYMTKAGVECDDTRLKRLVGLIGQKFITDIANDAMHHHRLRTGGGAGSSGGMGTGAVSRPTGAGVGKKNTLTLEDLSAALAEYGINIKRPSYYT